MALAREVGDRGLMAAALRHLAFNPAPDDDERALLDKAVSVAPAGGVAREVGDATVMLARSSLDGGDLAFNPAPAGEVRALLEEAVSVAQAGGAVRQVGYATVMPRSREHVPRRQSPGRRVSTARR